MSRRGFLGATGGMAAGAVAGGGGKQPEGPGAEAVKHAQSLADVEFTDAEREMMASDLAEAVGGYKARRAFALENGTGPATVFNPVLPGMTIPQAGKGVSVVVRREGVPALPSDEALIAFAPVTWQGEWLRKGVLSSERLTRICLDRLKRYGPKLECVVTLMEEQGIAQARRADAEFRSGRYRGDLHGIPWGAKDLFDTKGVLTTWGAMPYRERVADGDATVVRKLEEAGAVLVAKLTLGALAYGDIWYGGKTRNPWDIEQGSSGSSAGSASATAAGLVSFALGTETYGSVVSPSMRCGTVGLRPTFGRVSRTGGMALCWSLDKVGVLARRVEDAVLVLGKINGGDAGDPSSVDMGLAYDARARVDGVRVGYSPAWFEARERGGANDVDRAALEALRGLDGVEMVEIDLPDWPYSTLLTVLFAEAAAAFEELTLTDRDDELVWQEPQAWPNTFRRTWFMPAIEFVQAQRFRRRVCEMMAERFEGVDMIFGPSFGGGLLLITNGTGHPALTVRAGFREGRPWGVTLIGKLFDEGRLCEVGRALEEALGVWETRPEMEWA